MDRTLGVDPPFSRSRVRQAEKARRGLRGGGSSSLLCPGVVLSSGSRTLVAVPVGLPLEDVPAAGEVEL